MNKNKKINYFILNCILIGAILLIVSVYLFENNISVSYTLDMRKNDINLKDISIENERLIKQITKLGSMANIYLVSEKLNMVNIKTADYLTPVDEILAER